MTPPLLTLDNLVISQAKSFIVDEFTITDERGVPVGAVVQGSKIGDFFMGSRSLAVASTDPQGRPVAPIIVIKDPPNLLHDTYEVYAAAGEQPLARIRREITLFKTRLTVAMEGFADVEVAGNLWDLDFSMLSQGREIARVNAGWAGLGNAFLGKSTYHLAMTSGLSECQHAAILGTTMSLDMLRTKKRRSG